MQILISGGTGFLGRAFSEAILKYYQQRKQDIYLTWLTRDNRQAHPTGVTLMTYEALAQGNYPDGSFDVILNLAGAGIADARWSDARKEALLASRIKPTESLLEYIAQVAIKPKLLISGSAIGWYGAQGDKLLTENSTYETDFSHQLCEQWEQLAAQATKHGIPVAIVRTGVVIHPDGGMLGKLRLPFKLGLGGQLGTGKQIMSWISRDDWVAAIIFIIEHQLVGKPNLTSDKDIVIDKITVIDKNTITPNRSAVVYNLTAPNPVSNHTFTQTLGLWWHRPTFFTMPEFLLKLMFAEMSTLLIDGQNVLPQALLAAGFEFKQPTLKQALEQQS